MKPRALYLHIPFCKAKCLYCDFDSRALGGCELDDAMDRYCTVLTSQIDTYGAAGELDEVETVYIGGGTPSLLGGRVLFRAGEWLFHFLWHLPCRQRHR